jgi:hypothetical protein
MDCRLGEFSLHNLNDRKAMKNNHRLDRYNLLTGFTSENMSRRAKSRKSPPNWCYL